MANQKEEVIKEQKKLEQLQQIIEDMKTEIDNLPEMQDYTVNHCTHDCTHYTCYTCTSVIQ